MGLQISAWESIHGFSLFLSGLGLGILTFGVQRKVLST